jgi:hypothetical protein
MELNTETAIVITMVADITTVVGGMDIMDIIMGDIVGIMVTMAIMGVIMEDTIIISNHE